MDLEKILAAARKEAEALLGGDLIALLLYGSAAVLEHQPGVSDINLLVVAKTLEPEVLDRLRRFPRTLDGARLSAPLLMTPEHIRTSADVFPIEFLEIKEKHRVLFGEDPFARLEIGLDNLRHECEHELKGRLLRLRQSYLEIQMKKDVLQGLLLSAHNANFPAFRAALRLKKIKPPLTKEGMTTALAQHFGLDAELFKTLAGLRAKSLSLDLRGLQDLLGRYLTEVGKLAAIVDQL